MPIVRIFILFIFHLCLFASILNLTFIRKVLPIQGYSLQSVLYGTFWIQFAMHPPTSCSFAQTIRCIWLSFTNLTQTNRPQTSETQHPTKLGIYAQTEMSSTKKYQIDTLEKDRTDEMVCACAYRGLEKKKCQFMFCLLQWCSQYKTPSLHTIVYEFCVEGAIHIISSLQRVVFCCCGCCCSWLFPM